MKYYGIGVVILGLAAGTLQAEPVQWTVAEGGNGHWYEQVIAKSTVTWSEARDAAESVGGYLVTVTSAEEEGFIQNTFTECHSWAGGHLDNGLWGWITGEPWDYTNWYSGEPNGGSGSPQLEILFKCTGWNDMHASYERLSYIVEWPAAGACCVNGEAVELYNDDCERILGEFMGEGSDPNQVSCVPYCPSDLDGDGVVNVNDILILISAWGICP